MTLDLSPIAFSQARPHSPLDHSPASAPTTLSLNKLADSYLPARRVDGLSARTVEGYAERICSFYESIDAVPSPDVLPLTDRFITGNIHCFVLTVCEQEVSRLMSEGRGGEAGQIPDLLFSPS